VAEENRIRVNRITVDAFLQLFSAWYVARRMSGEPPAAIGEQMLRSRGVGAMIVPLAAAIH